jgi:methyl-accepting chemotaxis protein
MLNGLKIGMKIQLFVGIILLISSIITVLWLKDKFESQVEQNIYNQAQEIAIMSKNTLNMFMISGMISDPNNRTLFFEKTNKSKEILDFRVIRAQSVSDTYGPGLSSEAPKDQLDKQVLKTGEEIIVKETINGKETLRLIYPFKASKNFRGTDCTSCHFVKEDTVLGAASVTLDISEQMDEISNNITLLWIMAAVSFIVMLVIISFIANKFVTKPLIEFQNGLSNFFDFLNRKTTQIEQIDESRGDEIGQMAKVVNNNIKNVQNTILEDNRLIDEAKVVIGKVKNGWYSEQIQGSTTNPSLNAFKNDVNEMIAATKEHFNDMNKTLEQYVNMDYTNELKLNGIAQGGVFELLLKDINKLRDTITEMLMENKSIGLTLQSSSDLLLENVNQLNTNSNQAAAALEETAAAVEEVTANISTTTENVMEMANHATSVTKSVSDGQELANKTTHAMDDINNEVTAINEAITIIDQIAFQTNILSLNAAVEAATAGEAGKGFAVVAQEVRNLASRSAEAAKEIKDLVENASNKANEGKKTADSMIQGYNQLNDAISQTIKLISSVESASKKQKAGIVQINDAINALDKQTQINANIASQTQKIALETDKVADEAVENVDKKEFIGKNSVKAKTSQEISNQTQTSITKEKINTKKIIEVKPQDSDDEWASF